MPNSLRRKAEGIFYPGADVLYGSLLRGVFFCQERV